MISPGLMVGMATIAVGTAAMCRCTANYCAKCDCNCYQKLHFDFLRLVYLQNARVMAPRASTTTGPCPVPEFAHGYYV